MKTYEYARIQSDGHAFYCSDPEITQILIEINDIVYKHVSVETWKEGPFSFYNPYGPNKTELGPFFKDAILDNRMVYMFLRCLLDHGWEPFAADSEYIHLRLAKTSKTIQMIDKGQAQGKSSDRAPETGIPCEDCPGS